MVLTNQKRLEDGLELYNKCKDGPLERENPQAFYPAIFLYKGDWYKIPTQRFRKYPKSERQPRRRLRRQRRREYLRSLSVENSIKTS